MVGDIVTDVVVRQQGPLAAGSDTAADIRMMGGGSAANTAAWLAAQGADVTLCGVVGDDDAGAVRLAELSSLGVRCAVRRAPGAGTGSVIVLSDGDQRTMLCGRGANALLTPADVDAALATHSGAGHLHLSGYVFFDETCAPAGRHALTAARAHGFTTSVDAASAAPLRRLGPARFAEWVRGVDLLLANLDEAAVLAGTVATDAAALAAALAPLAHRVIVKCGAGGAVWTGPDGPHRAAAQQVARVVDPTGAGDAFAAGLLAAWLAGAGPTAALAAGTRLGARAVTLLGGRPPAAPPA